MTRIFTWHNPCHSVFVRVLSLLSLSIRPLVTALHHKRAFFHVGRFAHDAARRADVGQGFEQLLVFDVGIGQITSTHNPTTTQKWEKDGHYYDATKQWNDNNHQYGTSLQWKFQRWSRE